MPVVVLLIRTINVHRVLVHFSRLLLNQKLSSTTHAEIICPLIEV